MGEISGHGDNSPAVRGVFTKHTPTDTKSIDKLLSTKSNATSYI